MKNSGDKLFKLDPSAIENRALRFAARLSRGLVERILCFPELNAIYDKTKTLDGDLSFSDKVLQAMGVTWDLSATSDNPIPAEGPVVVVANHPFGGIEGVLLVALLEKWRPDSKVLVNYLLGAIPELRSSFFFVNPFGGPNAKRENLKSMRTSLQWLASGHLLATFPAGEVSSVSLRKRLVRDNVWSPTIARMVRRTGATVVPIHFSGGNGFLFNLLGLIHPRLRTLQLVRQFVNKTGRKLQVQVGQPITPREMEPFADDDSLSAFLRLRTYVLGEREQAKAAAAPGPQQARIVDPVDGAALAAEIAALPPETRMCEGEGLVVYCAEAPAIPQVLREIGRLREVTYREIGEGTNAEIDLDQYDAYYRHVFIWNPAAREIVGAYRMGLADEILAEKGVEGLYTHTCFKFGPELVERLQPAIELGRSFVRREYQKAFSSLMLLWKGIVAFVARHPKYRSLFGPVSISNDYLEASRQLMMRALRASHFDGELAPLISPRCAPRKAGRAEWALPEYDAVTGDLEQVSKLVQEIEPDQKAIPVLLRQYVKMGGRILCFNVDPAFNFSLDGFIAISIPDIDPRVLKRYMGTEEFAAYMAHYQEEK